MITLIIQKQNENQIMLSMNAWLINTCISCKLTRLQMHFVGLHDDLSVAIASSHASLYKSRPDFHDSHNNQ